MYRIALILWLLVTPAVAETYTARECETLAGEFECGPSSASGARRFDEIRKNHRKWALSAKYKTKTGFSPTEEAFDELRGQVCDGKVTQQDALNKYCPGYRPKTQVAIPDTEPYTQRDCAAIEMLLTACKVSGKRIPTELTKEEQLTLSRAYIWLGARHASWWGASGFAPTCTQLFESKITGDEVLHRYCPNYRAKP
ncbi:hypothetical protein [Bradyrhizobium sp. JYMT SZCCT0428]|uniref:hypothetical protein n=1 Tax=Bradyrhizobium sp. JYMT SZCCT0428 TaxID=2807673 RepID=UPI001BADCE44|nr:hypothetical protein [Bradyrhizobium sp. JYMT SZCCT0428]MBR1149842.1 hypothetical protein [Bradyrhizobium sp. JYMT SZCCT0428]